MSTTEFGFFAIKEGRGFLGFRVSGFYCGDTEVSFFTTELRREHRETRRKGLGFRVFELWGFRVLLRRYRGFFFHYRGTEITERGTEEGFGGLGF